MSQRLLRIKYEDSVLREIKAGVLQVIVIWPFIVLDNTSIQAVETEAKGKHQEEQNKLIDKTMVD